MVYLYFCVFLDFLQCCRSLQNLQGWNYINLHCRDNDNEPVDWWYIYKPPSALVPYLSSGLNYSFITPESGGRWQSAQRSLADSSMLQYTLSPMFRSTYVDHLAFSTYEENTPTASFPGTEAFGVLMADEMGGLWMGHTVKGFPDLTYDRPKFPEEEAGNGHLLVCMSVDLITLNEIANTLRIMKPNFKLVHVPNGMKTLLPDWGYLNRPILKSDPVQPTSLEFVSKYKTLRAVMNVRRPGDPHCLYNEFAKSRGVVLDVYSPTATVQDSRGICKKTYGIRSINSISLKFEESVHYIQPKADHTRFAVSTAAHWQRVGAGNTQYWVCINNLDKADRTGKGGMILCVDSYDIWLTFDNLKVREPEC